jgi:hypothetical protein
MYEKAWRKAKNLKQAQDEAIKLNELDQVVKCQSFQEWAAQSGKGRESIATFATQQVVWYVLLPTYTAKTAR